MLARLITELRFVVALFRLNLASAMAYRASFISQIVGMFINNGIYLVFWIIFFDEFGSVRGYELNDLILLFAIVAVAFGLADMVAGNTRQWLAYLIAQGRLDYYLVLPRPLLSHIVFSRLHISTIGDLTFGITMFLLAGRLTPMDILFFVATTLPAAAIWAGFGVLTGSLAFYLGNARQISQQAGGVVLTFALYPGTLFTGFTRLVLFTILPAALLGAVPVDIVRGRDTMGLAALWLAALLMWGLATAVFYNGLRRYESGSALNLNN